MHKTSEFNKILNHPEARHRYWHVTKENRDFFPEAHKMFQLEFHKHVYEMKINHKDDVMTGQLYEKYYFLEGNRITIKKKGKDSYVLEAPDTKKDPRA